METLKEAKEIIDAIQECPHCGSAEIDRKPAYLGAEQSTIGDIRMYEYRADCQSCGRFIKAFEYR